MQDTILEMSKAIAINLQLTYSILEYLVGKDKASEIYKEVYTATNAEYDKQMKKMLEKIEEEKKNESRSKSYFG